jgi:RNA polymerase sigma factor (sigma-70 family)
MAQQEDVTTDLALLMELGQALVCAPDRNRGALNAGQRQAYQQFYEKYLPWINQRCRTLNRSRGWAPPGSAQEEDLVQEVLWKVFTRLPHLLIKFDATQGAFRIWLERVILWAAGDFGRQTQRALATGSGDSEVLEALEQVQAPRDELSSADEDKVVEALARMQSIRTLLNHFTPRVRKAFELSEYMGLSIQDVAARLQISRAAVTQARARVWKFLRAHLQQLQDLAAISETILFDLKQGAESADTPSAEVVVPALPGFEVLDEVGRGGMGVVFRARQARPRRLVALKMPRGEAAQRPAWLASFYRDAVARSRLAHPNIVKVHQVLDYQGLPCLVMELLVGGNLSQRVRGKTPGPPREAAGLVETLARAIHFAHQKKIVHGDLNPTNVLLDDKANPHISDFGLARFLDGQRLQDLPEGTVAGTPAYMAPEQAEGKIGQVGPRTDVYALGATLYELLTGRPPFQGSRTETLCRVREEPPAPPRQARADVPEELEAICLKCLSKDPDARFSSALELAVALFRFRKLRKRRGAGG